MENADCEKVLNLIPLYLDNMLSDEENDITSRHLAVCEKCRKKANYMKTLIDKTGALHDIDLPEKFHKNLMEKAKKLSNKKKKQPYLILRKSAIPAVAALLILAVAITGNVDKFTHNIQEKGLLPSVSDEPMKIELDKKTKKSSLLPSGSEQKKEYIKTTPENSTQDSKAPALTDNVSSLPVAFSENEGIVKFSCVYVDLSDNDELLELLSTYEKDKKGYIVPDIDAFLQKLSSKNITYEIKNDEELTENYVILN